MYLIESLEHSNGELRLWWAPNGKGYTYDIDKAGRYSAAEALRICRDGYNEKMYLESEVLSKAVRMVRK